MRLSVAVAVSCLLITTLSAAEHAAAAIRRQTSIAPQGLGPALKELAKDHEFQILYRTEFVGDRSTAGAVGELTLDEALAKLLNGSGLTFQYLDDKTITILQAPAAGSPASSASPNVTSAPSSASDETTASKGQRSFWDRFRLAQAPEGNAALGASQSSAETAPRATQIEEIIVTAQKRSERLQDVPVPVTALNSETLVETNQLRLQDYYAKVPGFSLTMLGDVGAPVVTIRGITTGGYNNPTVGVVVDDIPFGATTVLGGGATAPDIDPTELARIEVLRGPQGTFYGTNSLGGLLKYVTVDPSIEALSGTVQVGTTGVRNGDDLGYSVRGAVNVPAGDTFAVRASGFTRRDPGYIDDPALGSKGVNETNSEGGRLSALWRPSEAFSLKLSALLQKNTRDGAADVHLLPGLSDLQQRALIDTGWYDTELQAHSATMTLALGQAELTSISGYSISKTTLALDGTPSLLGGLTQAQFGVRGFSGIGSGETKKFTQELRLTMPLGERIEWLLGGFYADEDSTDFQDYRAIDPANGAVAGTWLVGGGSAFFEEEALFTNLTFQLTDRFDVQIGGRGSWHELGSGTRDTTGPWNQSPFLVAAPSPTPRVITAGQRTEDEAFTFLVTPRFKVSPDLMAYARFASGYRPGGVNSLVVGTALPQDFGPDKTMNYELGLKGNLLNGMFSFDASAYYIQWDDIQIQLRQVFSLYTVNAGEAKSQGAEFTFELRPLDDLSISAWVAYNDAELTFVPTGSFLVARPGDRLPYSSQVSGNLSIEDRFSLGAATRGFVGASASFVDERKGRFFSNALPRQTFPSYTQVDLRLGAIRDEWTVTLFLNNALDERGVLRGGRDAALSLPYSFTYIQPRTLGVSLTKSF